MIISNFIFSFIAVGFIYSFLSATTKIFYKNKSVSELSIKETDILEDKANIKDRIEVFSFNLIGTLFFPPAYITAGVVTLLVFLFKNYTLGGSVGIFISVVVLLFIGFKFLTRQGVGHIKLHNLKFVDIKKEKDGYVYIYVVNAKLNFKDKYLKMVFKSKFPHYMWSDIQSEMMKNGVYFENLNEGESIDLNIGSLTYFYFTDSDFNKYGTDLEKWKSFLDRAVGKQREYTKKENIF